MHYNITTYSYAYMLCMDYNSIVYMYNIHCISMSHGLVITQYAIHVL